MQNKSLGMAMHRNDYIKHYLNITPPHLRECLIGLFTRESYLDIVSNNGKPNFTQINVNQHEPNLVKLLNYYLLQVVSMYRKDIEDYKWCPPVKGVEEFRVKRYLPNSGDRFDPHVDVGDITSCKRYLSLLFYLNDDYREGETVFEGYGEIIPQAGSVIVFPPTWQYPHYGKKVTGDKPKYIMSSYLNYT